MKHWNPFPTANGQYKKLQFIGVSDKIRKMLVQTKLVVLLNEVMNQTARLRKGGIQATYHCPFCADKNLVTQKLEIAIDGPSVGSFHCWRCDTKGRSFGSLLTKLKASNAYREKFHALTGDLQVLKRTNFEYEEQLTLPEEFRPLCKEVDSPEYKNARFYLKKRKVTLEDIVRYNIGYCESGPYDGHVIIPSYDANEQLNFFMGRRYYDVERAIPHKKPDVSMNVVGFESFINYNEPIILVESTFNAITIRRNVIPMFGKYPSKKLLERLIQNKVKKVYVCLDSDAKIDAIKICKKLINLGIIPYFVKIEGGKDPNEIGFEKSWVCINNAKEIDFQSLLFFRLGF